jgi:hypothetical protein
MADPDISIAQQKPKAATSLAREPCTSFEHPHNLCILLESAADLKSSGIAYQRVERHRAGTEKISLFPTNVPKIKTDALLD